MTTKSFRLFRTESSGFKLSLLSAGHFFNDLYASFLPTFIPSLISRLGITMAQAGFFSTVLGIIHIIFQPIIGYLSDRSANPWMIIWGPILTCVGASMIPLSPTYGLALVFVALWAFGSAMFHPQGHGGVGHVVPRHKLTLSLAFFSVAGTAGTTLSPLFAVALVETVGVNFLPVFATIPVVILGFFIWKTMPAITHESGDAVIAPQGGLMGTIKSVFAAIFPIWAMSTMRDTTTQGVRMFFPVRVAAEGGDIVFVGTVLFFIMLGSTVAMLLVGRVADRLGKKKTLMLTMGAASVFLFAGRAASGWLAIFFYALGTAAISATMPITAAIAQEMVPNSRAMASSIVMGLSWGLGNMFMGPFGKIGDLYGVNAILLIVAFLPLLAFPLFFTKAFKNVSD